MNMAPISTERLEALQFCADAFGGDPARWPAERRAEFADILDTNEAAAVLAEARTLDGFLNAATAPRMSEDLMNRVMANYQPPKPQAGLFEFLRSLAPVMRLASTNAARSRHEAKPYSRAMQDWASARRRGMRVMAPASRPAAAGSALRKRRIASGALRRQADSKSLA